MQKLDFGGSKIKLEIIPAPKEISLAGELKYTKWQNENSTLRFTDKVLGVHEVKHCFQQKE